MENAQAVDMLSALAQDTRLDVFRTLVQAGPTGIAAGAIGDRLDVSAPTLSFHLKEMRTAGIVRCRREGRSLIYSPDFEAMSGLLHFLTENCCREGARPDESPTRETAPC